MTDDTTPAHKPNSQDVQITAGGTTYRLRFSLRAMMALKDRWKLEDGDALTKRLASVGPFDFVDIVWAALRTHHPELNDEQVLGIVDDMGVEGIETAVNEAIDAGVPGGDPDPKKG